MHNVIFSIVLLLIKNFFLILAFFNIETLLSVLAVYEAVEKEITILKEHKDTSKINDFSMFGECTIINK